MVNQLEKNFITLITDNKNDFYKLAYSYVKNEHDALDAIGESVYKGYHGLSSLKEKKYMKTWFYRIVINESINITRKRKKVIYDSSILDNMETKHNESEDFMDLYQAIDRLSDKHKTVIILKYLQGFKIKEISEILKINENTVKSRINRSIKKLKEIMEEYSDE